MSPGSVDDPRRVLPLQGASNFRDLGGYPGHGGRPLRWRRLFRSDHLGGLTDADHATLGPLGLARIFDFRGQAERAATPNRLPGVAEHALSIEPSVVQRMQDLHARGATLDAALMTQLMLELYRGLVNDHAQRFAALFEHLLADDAPMVFHCTAGKDRTGVAAALLLLALGVPRALVLQDYLLTNRVFRPPQALHTLQASPPPPPPPEPPQLPQLPQLSQGPQPDTQVRWQTPPQALAVLWQVQEAFLQQALALIDSEHGGIDAYLQQRLGLTPAARQALMARYLAPSQG